MSLIDRSAMSADDGDDDHAGRGVAVATDEATLANLRPVRFMLTGIGPFRGASPAVIHFLSRSAASGSTPNQPCDVFVVSGDNGTGKTSLLRAIHGLFDLLSCRPSGVFADLSEAVPCRGYPRTLPSARLDMFADSAIDGEARRVVVTLWHGSEQPPVANEGKVRFDELCGGRDPILIGFACGTKIAAGTNDAGLRILRAIRTAEGTAMIDPQPNRSFAAGFKPLPTAVQFREVSCMHTQRSGRSTSSIPTYAPARSFNLQGDPTSQLIRRLYQLENSHLSGLLDELGDAVFLNPTPRSELTRRLGRKIQVDRGRVNFHRIDELGSGEIAMLTLHANSWLHMTTGTLLLVDALDDRVAKKWREKLCMTTLRLVLGRAGAMLILSTRDLRFSSMIGDAANELGLIYGAASLPNDDAL